MPVVPSAFIKTLGFIDGKWMGAQTGKTFAVENPATREIIAEVADLSRDDAELAIQAASRALLVWSQTPAKMRSQLLRAWFDLVIKHQDDLALLLTLEQGKPLTEARGEMLYGASYIEWFAEEAKRANGAVIPSPVAHKKMLVLKQPVGVVAVITPWNFPCAMLARKLAPALAAGCTVVAKPAAQTPLSALALASLAEQAGIPAGVINIVPSTQAEDLGQLFAAHPVIKKISFTGSTAVGKKLMALAASGVKRLSLELGGNAPFIVFDDADIDAAVEGAIASKFRNAGQTCICANRFYLHKNIAKAFTDKFAAAVAQLSIGNGLGENIALGPLIDQQAQSKVEGLVREAIDLGAVSIFKSKRVENNGYFCPAQILVQVPENARILQEEIFGPVAPLVEFEDEAALLTTLNQSSVGLAAYFYTQDRNRICRFAEQLDVGMVGINEGLISHEMAPFGGVKESGFGREGSVYGLDDYLQLKYICERV